AVKKLNCNGTLIKSLTGFWVDLASAVASTGACAGSCANAGTLQTITARTDASRIEGSYRVLADAPSGGGPEWATARLRQAVYGIAAIAQPMTIARIAGSARLRGSFVVEIRIAMPGCRVTVASASAVRSPGAGPPSRWPIARDPNAKTAMSSHLSP